MGSELNNKEPKVEKIIRQKIEQTQNEVQEIQDNIIVDKVMLKILEIK